MNKTFEARNEIETALLAAQEGRLGVEVFMDRLMQAQLFMPVYDDSTIKNFQRTNKAQPLALEAADGTKTLVLFTSPERAKPFVKDRPGYEGGILTDLGWILANLGSGYAIALNPGWDVGLDLDRHMVAQLAERASAAQ